MTYSAVKSRLCFQRTPPKQYASLTNPPWLTLKPNTSCPTLKNEILYLFLMYQMLCLLLFLSKHHPKPFILQTHGSPSCQKPMPYPLISQPHACSSDPKLLHHSLTPETLFSGWNPSHSHSYPSRFALTQLSKLMSHKASMYLPLTKISMLILTISLLILTYKTKTRTTWKHREQLLPNESQLYTLKKIWII